MWALLPRSAQLTAILATGFLIAWSWDVVELAFTGQHAAPLKLVSSIVFILGVVLVGLFNASWRWFWRKVPALGRWVFPDLTGRWEGKLLSTFPDPTTKQVPPPIDATVWIRQSLFKTSVRLKTGESGSFSTRAFLEPNHDHGCYRIWYTYNNEPDAQFRHRSSPHEGVSFLDFETGTPGQLKGTYYTARKTTGDMTLVLKSDDPDS